MDQSWETISLSLWRLPLATSIPSFLFLPPSRPVSLSLLPTLLLQPPSCPASCNLFLVLPPATSCPSFLSQPRLYTTPATFFQPYVLQPLPFLLLATSSMSCLWQHPAIPCSHNFRIPLQPSSSLYPYQLRPSCLLSPCLTYLRYYLYNRTGSPGRSYRFPQSKIALISLVAFLRQLFPGLLLNVFIW